MRQKPSSVIFLVLPIIFMLSASCKSIQLIPDQSEPGAPMVGVVKNETKLTQAVLKERLTAKGVTIKPEEKFPYPNPSVLEIKFADSKNLFKINREGPMVFSDLANLLREVYKNREKNGVFAEGTNEVEMTLTLPASQSFLDRYNGQNIYVEDFEKLVDDLQAEGFNKIQLDLEGAKKIVVGLTRESADEPPSNTSGNSRTISGGVLNGKAVNLVKPEYPAAAKAVRASGAVNVQVTIDEEGNVISALAVSGHPLLRSAAVQAARASKFSPTKIQGEPVKVTGVIVYNFTP